MTTAIEKTARLIDLLRKEHHALAEFLVALAAFDAERGWFEVECRSLFEFLQRKLGLPNGPAFYRMTAAGLIRKYPEIVEPLRDGRLHLTSVNELAKVITPENRAEVLPRFFHLSKREAKEVVAELAPAAAPPVRTVVTAVRPEAREVSPAIPVPGPCPAPPNRILPEEVIQKRARELPLAQEGPQPTQVEPLTAEKSRLHVTVSRRLLQKLAAARDALSHSHPAASEETILEVGLDLILERFAKRRGFGAKPRKSAPEKTAVKAEERGHPPSTARSRYVPAPIRRAVWQRDGGCCAWPLEGGGVCGSTYQLEFDHVDGWALGCETTVETLRLLCRWHQNVSARRLYGDDLMNRYTKPKGPTCFEPVAAYGGAAAPARLVRRGRDQAVKVMNHEGPGRAGRPGASWSSPNRPGAAAAPRRNLDQGQALVKVWY